MDKDVRVPTSPKIFMFPWLAFGHVLPFLQVANKLSDRGFYIYLCSTPVNLDSIKKKISQKHSSSIKLVELHIPADYPDLPPPLHTTNGLPPRLMPKLKSALYRAKPLLSEILGSLKPDLVIYDAQQLWTEAVASRHNIPAVSFGTVNALTVSYFVHMTLRPGIEYPYPAIRFSDIEKTRIRQCVESPKLTDEAEDDDSISKGYSNGILIIRSSREIEGKYVEYISILSGLKVIPVCPILISEEDHHHQREEGEGDGDDDEELIQWLGDKNERSSVYVSFGSEYFLNKRELEEIAFGLELSNVNFVWVLRFPKGEETQIQEAVPEGFLERVKGRGRIITGWAPQVKFLGHPSIGGFVSHCGWNSVIESVENGVPIIAIPMHLDQPLNARLIVETGIGTEVKRDIINGSLDREEIAKQIKDVVMGETGQNMRTKTSYLFEKLKSREEEEIDGLVNILKQLCDY